MIKIEKEYPIPYDVYSKSKYPWKLMEIGDCFFVPTTNDFLNIGYTEAGRRLNKKFLQRKVEGGFRIWRVA